MPIIFDILNCLTPRVAAPAHDIEHHQQDQPPHTRPRYQDDREHPQHPEDLLCQLIQQENQLFHSSLFCISSLWLIQIIFTIQRFQL